MTARSDSTARAKVGRPAAVLIGFFLFAFLMLCNLGGERRGALYPDSAVTHGWPLEFLERRAAIADDEPMLSIWALTSDVDQFHLGWLLINVAACLAIAVGSGLLYLWWRRQRNHVWQLHIRDILSLVLVLAAVFAYGRHCVNRGTDQAELIARLKYGENHVKRGLLGPDWLREILGISKPWPSLDPVVQAEMFGGWFSDMPADSSDVMTILEVETLEALSIQHAIADELPARRIVFPNRLRELDLEIKGQVAPQHLDGIAELDQLRYLTLGVTVSDADIRWLDRLTRLRSLNLMHTGITDQSLHRIGSLLSLRELRLGRRPVMKTSEPWQLRQKDGKQEPTARLRRVGYWDLELGNVKIISGETDGSEITDQGLKQLEPLKSLEILELSRCAISDESLDSIASLQGLRELYLDGTPITNDGLSGLISLSELHTLGLAQTSITLDGLKSLTELPSLQLVSIDKEDETLLRKARTLVPSIEFRPVLSTKVVEFPKTRSLFDRKPE